VPGADVVVDIWFLRTLSDRRDGGHILALQ
jgi:hypothetical protein